MNKTLHDIKCLQQSHFTERKPFPWQAVHKTSPFLLPCAYSLIRVTAGIIEPFSSSCGPTKPSRVVKNNKEKAIEKPMVQKMKIPNWKKKTIFAPNKNIDAPKVVQAPERTEIPTFFKVWCTLVSLVSFFKLIYPSAR